jgi:hypothetical protein
LPRRHSRKFGSGFDGGNNPDNSGKSLCDVSKPIRYSICGNFADRSDRLSGPPSSAAGEGDTIRTIQDSTLSGRHSRISSLDNPTDTQSPGPLYLQGPSMIRPTTPISVPPISEDKHELIWGTLNNHAYPPVTDTLAEIFDNRRGYFPRLDFRTIYSGRV